MLIFYPRNILRLFHVHLKADNVDYLKKPLWKKNFFWIFLQSTHQVDMKLGPFARTCNPSKWEADIWGWLEVRRSAMLHFNERQRPHWACRQYGHTGGTRRWLGVERWQLCLRDTSRSANCHRRAAVGHWISLYVKCCRMVDSVPIWHTISIL